MPRLLSGSTLRSGGSGEFIDLAAAQPQLPATPTTATGFTIATDGVLRSDYRSSLGFIEFFSSTVYSALPDGVIRVLATGSSFLSTTTNTGNLVIQGGVGIGGNMHVQDDIVVNGITIGRGYEGVNNLVFRGTAAPQVDNFENGQESIAIGYDSLTGLITSYKNISIGRYALSSGSNISNSIAIGDSALKYMGTENFKVLSSITNVTLVASQSVSSISNAIPAVVQTIGSHGFTTGTQILITGVNGISTYSGGPSEINSISLWVNYLSGTTFEVYSNRNLTVPFNSFTATVGASVVSLTAYSSGGTITSPVLVTSPSHNITTGTYIYIDGLVGSSALNQNYFYPQVINTNTLALFQDSILETPIDGTSYGLYASSGTIFDVRDNDNNIAIGIDAAKNLVDGSNNFFFGNNIANNLTTGSNNTIIGHNQFNNLTRVNGVIAIGADNLVDLRDNQINIGSAFYYDGAGNTDINSDARIGLGTDSTSTNSGALVVLGGMAVAGNIRNPIGGVGYEGYLVYTPTITVTTGTPPPNPRLGDVWIDVSVPAYLQWILDGTSTFWVQVGAV